MSNRDRTYTPTPANAVNPNNPNATGTVSNAAAVAESGLLVAAIRAASITWPDIYGNSNVTEDVRPRVAADNPMSLISGRDKDTILCNVSDVDKGSRSVAVVAVVDDDADSDGGDS